MQPRRHAVVNDAPEREQRRVVGIRLGQPAENQLRMSLRPAVPHIEELRRPLAIGRGRELELASRWQRAEGPFEERKHLVVADGAGDAEHHIARAVAAAEVASYVGQIEALHVLRRAGDAIAERMIRKDRRARDVVDVH